jgi:hypothetical protein
MTLAAGIRLEPYEIRAHPTQFNFYRFWRDGSASELAAGAYCASGPGRFHLP